MRARALRAAVCRGTVRVESTFSVALRKMRARILVTTLRETFETIVTVIVIQFETIKASFWVGTLEGRAAESGLNAIKVLLTEFFTLSH